MENLKELYNEQLYNLHRFYHFALLALSHIYLSIHFAMHTVIYLIFYTFKVVTDMSKSYHLNI